MAFPSLKMSRQRSVRGSFCAARESSTRYGWSGSTYTTQPFRRRPIFSFAEAEKAEARTVTFLVTAPLPSTLKPYGHLDKIPCPEGPVRHHRAV